VRRPAAQAPGDAWLALLEERIQGAAGLVPLRADLQGIHCAACVWLVEHLFRRLPGAHAIVVNPGRGSLEATVDASFPVRRFALDLAACGYGLGATGRAKEAVTSDLRLRMGVCIALAMNAMIFAIGRYAGLAGGPLARFFDALGFGLATLSVMVGAPTFFRAALSALRRGALHLDVPISLGIATAYASSAWSFFRGRDAIYFDTLAVFVALMLVGRFLRERAIERARAQILEADPAESLFVRRVSGGSTEIVPARDVRSGDVLLLAAGDVVPVEGELESARAELALEWITGESEPVAFERGGVVPAGAFVSESGSVRLRARQDFAVSDLRALLAPPAEPSGPTAFWNTVGTVYVAAVLVVAALAGAGWWTFSHDVGRTADVLTSIFIVTCPCALGIALPLAYELFHARLAGLGVRVRSSSLLDRARGVRTVVFDKTGTLTTGELRLENPEVLASLEDEDRRALAWMTLQTSHPKALAVRRALPPADVLGSCTEHPARGLSALVGAHEYRLGKGDFVASLPTSAFAFARDGRVLASFELREEPRPDAAEEVRALRDGGFSVRVLSGDAPERVAALAARVGVEDAEGGLSPWEKAQRLRENAKDALFVGDGINDAPAFREALCSATPVVDRPFVPARTDFFLVGSGLRGVRGVLEAARSLHRVVTRNLVLALSYNVATLVLACAGLLSPLLCAVLMPASSVTAILLSLAGARAWNR